MTKAEVTKALNEGQRTFYANVSDKRTTVRILTPATSGGWIAENTTTGHTVRIKSAARLHGVAKGEDLVFVEDYERIRARVSTADVEVL